MHEVSIIGLDLAKNLSQAHGAAADGTVVFRRKLTLSRVLGFFARQRRCIVAMEACASAGHSHALGVASGCRKGMCEASLSSMIVVGHYQIWGSKSAVPDAMPTMGGSARVEGFAATTQ